VDTAVKNKISVQQPFAGMCVGPFRVVSPFQGVYPYFIPQFDRTPEPDQAAIEAAGYWIGKGPGLLARIFEKAAAKVQKWIDESWENERLKDGGCTSASNESSVVLYGDFGPGRRVLLTGDAGIWASAWRNAMPIRTVWRCRISCWCRFRITAAAGMSARAS
jgi:hypothetical protein